VIATGSNWIEVEFNGAASAGATWQLDGPMTGISPTVTWPQSGTVVSTP
jgi:hypothetical protein